MLQIRTLAREFGLDFPELLATAGAAPDVFDDPEARLPSDVLGRLLEGCASHTDCPHFGLLVGRRFDATSLGELGGLMKNCTSVREALALGTAHLQVTDQGAMSFMLDVGDGRTALGYALFAGVIPGAEYIQDGGLTMQYLLLRELCGPSWRPLLVRLSRARPTELKPYRAVFGENLEFDADLSAIIFDSRWLDQPISGASSNAFNAAARAIQSKEASDPVPFSRQVHRAIRAMLFSSSGSTPKLARLFNVAPRTLRRRLAEEDATVRSLTNDVRRELAFHLLRDTQLKISQVAEALRYADAAVFSRAFRLWTGMSPRRWRAKCE
ncbi:MAG: AraC family transcriptional regulator [Steroidobacteraceae bacterium]|nr:AraC family transcriptional regulator [Steroidobacteraceae bacterium]